MAAAPIIAVTVLKADVGQSAWIQLAQMLPFLLFSIPAGVLADRMSRTRLMTLGEVVRAASLFCVPFLVWASAINVPLLALLGFVGSLGSLAYSVSIPALTHGLVGRDLLPVAIGRLELMRSIAFIGGPALAGALIGWTGASEAFVLAAVLSVLAVLLLCGLPDTRHAEPARRGHFLDELKEGGGFVWHNRLLRPAFCISIVFNTAFFALQTVFAPYAVARLSMSASDIGLTLSMYGAGMIVGGLCVPGLVRRMSIGAMLTVAPLSGLLASLALLATLWQPWQSLAWLCFFIMGSGPVLWTVSFTTLRQLITPPALIGRVTSINSLATYGARPLGAAVAGVIGSRYGMPACLYAIAAVFAFQAVLFFMTPLPRLPRSQKLSF